MGSECKPASREKQEKVYTGISSGLFGLRLAPSLHLGHFVGNIAPAIEDQGNRTIIVVLADLFAMASNRRDAVSFSNILSMMAECIALGLDSRNVLFSIQSRVAAHLQTLVSLIGAMVSFKKLSSVQPVKGMLEDPGKLNVSALNFPILQCAEILSTKSEFLYSNIDNLGVVSIAKSINSKLSKYSPNGLPHPTLKHGIVPVTHGIDGQKMSFASNNGIFFSDTDELIIKKISKIDTHPLEDQDDLPDFSLVAEYFRILGLEEEKLEELITLYRSRKLTALDIKMQLAEAVIRFVKPIREARGSILAQGQEQLVDRLMDDTLRTEKIVQSFGEEILEKYFVSNYYRSIKEVTL